MRKIMIIMGILAVVLLVGCTEEKFCTEEYAPVCGVDGVTYSNACTAGDVEIAFEGACSKKELQLKFNCEELNGTWISEANECEYISQEDCEALDGTFNECASACRNDPDTEICTMQCVLVCKF